MMTHGLPFTRIAIFSKDLITGDLDPLINKEAIKQSLTHWISGLNEKGADAIYLRVDKGEHALFQCIYPVIMESYNGTLIFPFQFAGLCPNSGFIHFKSNEEWKGTDQKKPAGKSCHNVDEVILAEKEGYSYVLLSPVFPTESHPGQVALGLHALQNAAKRVNVPIFALGGVTRENIKPCLDAGAAGIASIRYFLS